MKNNKIFITKDDSFHEMYGSVDYKFPREKEMAEYFSGYYYHIHGDDIYRPTDIFNESWSSVYGPGPIRQDIIGPFETEEEAIKDFDERRIR